MSEAVFAKNTLIKIKKFGFELIVTPIGATLVSLKIPNKQGALTNVVLGLKEESDYQSETYLENCVYLGSTVGRYAGRISGNSFQIDGKEFQIYQEEGVHLHGGKSGFDKKIWTVEMIEESKIVLSYFSKNLEEGYPGNLKVFATYELTENGLQISYEATTDNDTIVNLTNHSYFNLSGQKSILDHSLKLDCSHVLEVNDQLIPSGKLKKVENSKFDFLTEKIIGENQFKGLDDTFIFDDGKNEIQLYSESSGIKMRVKTNQPAAVIYTPKSLNHLTFQDDVQYSEYPAICFETQKFPDNPNQKHFPSTLLKVGETYKNETTFTFSIE